MNERRPTLVAALPPRSFSDVDSSGQAADHAAYLDRAAAQASASREAWLARLDLAAGHVVLDAGSGMGEVARLLADRVGPRGRAVGVDLSSELVERAQARAGDRANLDYRVADLTALPFDADTFDAVYSERVFMHLDDPGAAMAELWRVLRPGGRIVVVDPDHSRAATDADDAQLADLLVSQIVEFAANPRSGRHLRSQAIVAGFIDVNVEASVQLFLDREELRAVSPRPVEARLAALVDDGSITQERADAYLRDQDRRAAEGRFQVATVWYVVTATKPPAVSKASS